jgi:hypothetical protein
MVATCFARPVRKEPIEESRQMRVGNTWSAILNADQHFGCARTNDHVYRGTGGGKARRIGEHVFECLVKALPVAPYRQISTCLQGY